MHDDCDTCVVTSARDFGAGTPSTPAQPDTPSAALAHARAAGVSVSEARALLAHVTGARREWLLAHDDAALAPDAARRFVAAIAARARGEPLAYLLGMREFFGLAFDVGPAVLIPRPETELLVEFACATAPPNARVLDLGTGSGAIAVAIAHARPDLVVTATDRSAAALAYARGNAARHATRVALRQGDWYGCVAGERFDVIVSNPPYIAARDAHLDAGDLRFEPRDALTDGADGLSALRAIASGAQAHLVKGGVIAVEHGYDQDDAVRALFETAGLRDVTSRRDLAGIARMTIGRAA